MTAHAAGNLDTYPAWSGRGHRVDCHHNITIGASGAIASEETDDPKFAATLDSTGTYDLVFPACPRVTIHITVLSAAATVTHGYVTALDASAGTATIKVSSVSAVAEPASGDVIMITYHMDRVSY